MSELTDKEKQELLDFARSSELRNDFEQIKENHEEYMRSSFNADDYIHFLSQMNTMLKHKRKPFKKIEGDNFKI